MRTLVTIGLVLSLMILVTPDAFAQGRGGGGRRGMRGRSGAGQYGNVQAGVRQRQMMQNRMRQGQPGMGSRTGTGQHSVSETARAVARLAGAGRWTQRKCR